MDAPLIAIVDDDAAIRTGLSSLLRSMSYAVSLFESAETFLRALPTLTPECIVTDIQMPGMSGLDLLKELRQRGTMIPVIVMTAFAEPALRERALAGGAICFLGKPFEADGLLGCIRRALAS